MFTTTYAMCSQAIYGYPAYQMHCDSRVWPESVGQLVYRSVVYQPVVQFVESRIPVVQDVVVDARQKILQVPDVVPRLSPAPQKMPTNKVTGMRKRLPVFAKIHIKGILEKKAREQENTEMRRATQPIPCRQFVRNGKCSFGSGCFFSHQLRN